MLRRELLSMLGVGAVASSMAFGGVKFPESRNWSMVVGGNRSGKSTIGSLACKSSKRYYMLGADTYFAERTAEVFGLDKSKCLSSECMNRHVADDNVYGDLLWIDESLRNYDFYDLAKKFDRVLWTTWPHEEARLSEFYRHCNQNGVVTHIPMRPEFQPSCAHLFRSREEHETRLLGRFCLSGVV